MATKPLIQQVQDDLNEVIDKYRDQGITLGETLGAMFLTALDLWHENAEHEDPF